MDTCRYALILSLPFTTLVEKRIVLHSHVTRTPFERYEKSNDKNLRTISVVGALFHWHTQQFSRSYNDSSSGANLTLYSGVIFWGVILTPKSSLKNFFSGVKVTPDIEELK